LILIWGISDIEEKSLTTKDKKEGKKINHREHRGVDWEKAKRQEE